MTNCRPVTGLISLFLPFYATSLMAAEIPAPVGEWLVKDKTAHIQVIDCRGALWGVISWTAEPGTDQNNPDPAKQGRSVIGLPILLNMETSAALGEWEGKIYNADNGKIYSGDISLKSPDILHVEGCVLGIMCGGEDWTRLKSSSLHSPHTSCEELQKGISQ
jgi:uncharacterized protein (DUF2147 family)